MIVITSLTSNDFINPKKAEQAFFLGKLKNGEDLHYIECISDLVFMNGKCVLNRLGDTNHSIDLNALIQQTEPKGNEK